MLEQNRSALRKKGGEVGWGRQPTSSTTALSPHPTERKRLPREVGSCAQDHRICVWAILVLKPELSDSRAFSDQALRPPSLLRSQDGGMSSAFHSPGHREVARPLQ